MGWNLFRLFGGDPALNEAQQDGAIVSQVSGVPGEVPMNTNRLLTGAAVLVGIVWLIRKFK